MFYLDSYGIKPDCPCPETLVYNFIRLEFSINEIQDNKWPCVCLWEQVQYGPLLSFPLRLNIISVVCQGLEEEEEEPLTNDRCFDMYRKNGFETWPLEYTHIPSLPRMQHLTAGTISPAQSIPYDSQGVLVHHWALLSMQNKLYCL